MAAWHTLRMATQQMCGELRLGNVVLAMIEAPYDALIGEYGLAWQVVSWGVTVPVLLTGLLAWLLLLDRKFGWGLTGSLPHTEPMVSSDEVLAHDANHGAAENGHKAPDGGEAGPDALRALVRWVPHPDDPPPTEASPTPE